MRTLLIPLVTITLLAASCGGGSSPGTNPFGNGQTPTATSASPTATAGSGSQPGASPSPAATSTPANPGTYTVQEGDTLGAIAERFGITIEDLVRANALSDPDLIFPGQQLIVPPSTTPTP